MNDLKFKYQQSLTYPIARILEINQIKLSILPEDQIRKILNYDYNELILNLKSEIVSTKSTDSNVIKPSLNDIIKAFHRYCDMSVLRDSYKNKTLFIYDPRNKIMDSSLSYVEQLLGDLSSHYIVNKNGQLTATQFEIVIDDLKKMSQQLVTKLKNNSMIRDFEKLPPNYIVTLNDKVIDIVNREVYDLHVISQHYDIVNKNHFNFTQVDNDNKENVDTKSIVNRQIIKRVMIDWSGSNKELEDLLWQLIYSVIQNNNHDKAFILIGSGGNGKSTYLNLLRIISGSNNVVDANMHQFGDPNAINKIDSSTKVVIGDDLATNYKISSTTLSNLKSIITGDPLSVAVKYQDNTVIQTNAVIIQATNTDISVFENNAALKSRLILIHWTNDDFRSKKSEIEFDLNLLMKDQSFIDDWAMMCLEKVKYFNEFTIPESVKKATEEMIENNDTIKQFMDEYWYRINKFKKIPIKLLYASYSKWCKDVNPNGGLMKLQTFTKEIAKHSSTYQFNVSDRSNRTSFKTDKFIQLLKNLCDLQHQEIDLSKQLYLESLSQFTTYEIEQFSKQFHPLEHELSDEEYQIAIITSVEHHRKDLISIYHIE